MKKSVIANKKIKADRDQIGFPTMQIRTLILIAIALLVAGCNHNRTLPPTKNTLVNQRLVILYPENAEAWVNEMRRSLWFEDLVAPTFPAASGADVEAVDQRLAEFLLQSAKQDEDRGEYFKSGLEGLSQQLDQYFGQFFLVKTKERQLMVCVYSHMEANDVRPGDIAHYSFPPWVCDGNGANFFVYFDMETKEFDRFHISGSQAGPFGDNPY